LECYFRSLEAAIKSLPENGETHVNIDEIRPTRRQVMEHIMEEGGGSDTNGVGKQQQVRCLQVVLS
jgi:hypothetical protein